MVGCPTCLMPFLSHAYFLCEKLWLLFADWKFACSAKHVGFFLCFTIGILQNFLEGCDSKYFKAFFSQFSILTGKIFSHLEFSNWLTSSHMFLQIFQWLANMPGELEGCIRPVCPVLIIFIAVPNIMWINVRVRLDVL
jgi:hypothetical protein